MRFSTLSFLASFLFLTSSGTTASPATDGLRRAVIVELFTSEGCSSCPPADALLQKLDQTQPVTGAMVVALSEHVDYWDRLGWKDPFSSPIFSRRQEAYGRRFHLDSVYTPQVVIDGSTEALGSDARQIEAGIRHSMKADRLGVQISPVFYSGQGVAMVHVQVDPAEKTASRANGRLMVALAENAAISHVLRGENSGRKLEHVAVVRILKDSGRVGATGVFNVDIPLTGELKDWSGKRLVVFVQDEQVGPIRGAAFRMLLAERSN